MIRLKLFLIIAIVVIINNQVQSQSDPQQISSIADYTNVRKLQISAFERGRDKADTLLALYGEKRGKVLEY
jgi:hypothetical protein